MKRILYFHHAIGDGGAPRSLSLLIAGLQNSDFEPIVVMPDRQASDLVAGMFENAGAHVIKEKDIRPFNGSEVAPCRRIKDRAYAILSYRGLVKTAERLVKKIKPDLVHLNSTCLVGAAKGTHLANRSIPVIAHVREPLLSNWWGRMLAQMNRRHVNYFVSIDQAGLTSIGNIHSSRGVVIRNFVDPVKFHPCEETRKVKRTQLGWNPDEVVFLSLSRVCAHNGAAELVELVDTVADKLDHSARFVIAGFHGSSPYEKHAQSLIRNSSHCSELSFDPDPGSLINAADVIIAPFVSPHSARSVFEGAAIGKPAIVSDMPNLTELIVEGETGKSFQFSKPNSFIEAVNCLCSSDTRRQYHRDALDFASKNFYLATNVKRTQDVYHALLEKAQP